MIFTSAQIKEIIEWRDRHQQMLQVSYPHQFIAFSSTRLLAAGMDYSLVKSTAEQTGERFLIEWVASALTPARCNCEED